jgi:hypothetical protein
MYKKQRKKLQKHIKTHGSGSLATTFTGPAPPQPLSSNSLTTSAQKLTPSTGKCCSRYLKLSGQRQLEALSTTVLIFDF